MANFFATNLFNADGVSVKWPFSFAGVTPGNDSGTTPYLHPEDVHAEEVYMDGEGNPRTVTRLVQLTAPNVAFIIGPPVAIGRQVRIYRKTEIRFPLVDYRDKQTVSEADLDLANRQAIFVAQETLDAAAYSWTTGHDGSLSAQGAIISNVGNGYLDSDAVNVSQLNHTIRIPGAEPAIPALPPPPARANKLLAFDSLGSPIVTIPASGSVGEFAINLADKSDPAKGATMVGFTRSNLTTAIKTVQQLLTVQPYQIYEFEEFVTDKPNPQAPDTWDWTPAIQRAFDTLPPNAQLVLSPGTYRSLGATRNGPIQILAGGGVTLMQAADQPVITLTGGISAVQSIVSLGTDSVDLTEGESVKTICTKVVLTAPTDWAVGDMVKVIADDRIIGSANDEQRVGEFTTIIKISGTTVYLAGELRDSYVTNPRIYKQMPDQFVLHGLTFDTVRAQPWTSGLVNVMHSFNSRFDRLTCVYGYGIFLHVQSAVHYSVDSMYVQRLINAPASGRYGYGISDKASHMGVVTRSLFNSCRHGYTTGTSRVPTPGSDDVHRYGRTYGAKITDCHGTACTNSPFDAHECADAIEFHNCTAQGSVRGPGSSGSGFQMRGRDGVLHGCIARNCRVGFLFLSNYVNETTNQRMVNCSAFACTSQAISASGSAGRVLDRLTINGGFFESQTTSQFGYIGLLQFQNNPTFAIRSASVDYVKVISVAHLSATGTLSFDLSKAARNLTNIRCINVLSTNTSMDIDEMRIIGAPITVASQAICEGSNPDTANRILFKRVLVDRATEGSKSGQTAIGANVIDAVAGTTNNFISRVITASGQWTATNLLYGDITSKFTGTGSYTLGDPPVGKMQGQEQRVLNASTGILSLPAGGNMNLTEPLALPPKTGALIVWDGILWNVAS